MRVFNLTDQIVDYRGRHIPAYGSVEVGEITFLPNRDRFLEDQGMLAFGALPAGWKRPQKPAPEPEKKAEPKKEEPKKVEAVKVVDSVKVETPAPVMAPKADVAPPTPPPDVLKDDSKSDKKSKK